MNNFKFKSPIYTYPSRGFPVAKVITMLDLS